jgi:general stress protein YciG
MELKEYHYTYYSYEEWGRGYFGVRTCECLPEEDVEYFGSFSDKSFRPTQKIILKSDYTTRVEANADEIILQDYYDVGNNPHFANRAKATSTGFYVPRERAIENGKLGGRIGGLSSKEDNLGFFSLTKEKRIEASKKGGRNAEIKNKQNGTGLYGIPEDERIENSRKGGKRSKELGLGIHALTPEQKSELGIKNGNQTKKLGLGIFARTKEQMSEAGRKGAKRQQELCIGIFSQSKEDRRELARRTNSQKWQCTETGFITNPGNLTKYQRARGIDTSKRIRIE